MNTVSMTPEKRNEIIRAAIDMISGSSTLGVCVAVFAVCPILVNGCIIMTIEKAFEVLNIPLIFSARRFYWPIEDRKSRISFLKSQITC